tara:strand:- start:81 stop:218 length:138 start_codon:yes stop_codon:yes gene_type:complete
MAVLKVVVGLMVNIKNYNTSQITRKYMLVREDTMMDVFVAIEKHG